MSVMSRAAGVGRDLIEELLPGLLVEPGVGEEGQVPAWSREPSGKAELPTPERDGPVASVAAPPSPPGTAVHLRFLVS